MVDRSVSGDDAGADLLALFAVRSEALGVRVARVGGADDAAAWVAAVARELGVERVLTSTELAASAPTLVHALSHSALTTAPPVDAASTRDEPLGLTLARLAVAETGSVLLAETTLADRSIGMLCLSLIVVCATAAVVPSLDEAAPVLREYALAGGMATLVTGPSRTADIERVLTVGVQGPGRVFVLFVDDLW